MPGNLIAILFALASALTIAWGTVVRHRIVIDTPAEGSPLKAAAKTPLWWAGLSTAFIGYGLQIVALHFGALLVVQPVLVLSLMFTLILAARRNNRALTRAETFWSTALSIGVAVFLVVGRPSQAEAAAPLGHWIVAMVLGVVVLVLVSWFAGKRRSRRKALLLGLVTGALFGYVALFSKAVVSLAATRGLGSLVTSWELYTLILGAILGTVVQQYSFQAGPLSQSLPAMTIGEPIVAFGLGLYVLGERFQIHSVAGYLVLIVALVATLVATWELSQTTTPKPPPRVT